MTNTDMFHREFYGLDLEQGWTLLPGYPPSIQEKILTNNFHEEAGKGHKTRLLRFQPGAFTTKPFKHDYWEEVLLISGDLEVADSQSQSHKESFAPFTYACRPPGIDHGPFRSVTGCLLYEIHYFL